MLRLHRAAAGHRKEGAAALQSFSQGRSGYRVVTPTPQPSRRGGRRGRRARGRARGRDRGWAGPPNATSAGRSCSPRTPRGWARKRRCGGGRSTARPGSISNPRGWPRWAGRGICTARIWSRSTRRVSGPARVGLVRPSKRKEKGPNSNNWAGWRIASTCEIAWCSARPPLVPHETRRWLAGIDPSSPPGGCSVSA